MSDAPPPSIINKTGSAVVAAAVLTYSMSLFAWLILFGKSENLLHQQAMTLLFIGMSIGMGALGLAFVIERIVPLFRKPQ